MWFLNRFVNPVVALILGSPIHRILSGSVMLLAYVGLKSSHQYMTPVQYARDGNIIYVVPSKPDGKTWWRNLREPARVEVTVGSDTIDGTAEIVTPRSNPKRYETARATYLARFPGSMKVVDAAAIAVEIQLDAT